MLRRRFGERAIKIVRENVPMTARYIVTNAVGGERQTRLEVATNGRGEEYMMNCPFCSDTRKRLSINHRWGVLDRETGTRNLWLAKCYNEDCLKHGDARRELFDQVCTFAPGRSSSVSAPPDSEVAGVRQTRAIKLPSGLWPLSDMVTRSPNHPAVTYLQDRFIDPRYVGQTYKALYCVDSSNVQLTGRLVVPIIKDGCLFGWQARLLRAPLNKEEPKWYTAAGCNVSNVLYNGDVALTLGTVVLVEGITDVWGFGRQACGVFKKAISALQLDLLVTRTRADATVVVLFDPDQHPTEAAKGMPHHIEAARQLLCSTSLRDRVLPVYLPSGMDPGDLNRAYMRELIKAEAARVKLKVEFE